MHTPRRSHRVLAGFGLLVFAACGSDSPTDAGPRVASVTVTPAARGDIVSNLVAIGDTVRLIAVVKDGSGNVLTGRSVDWTSESPALAKVSATGLVTGIARNLADTLRGATITASSDQVSGSAPIVVVSSYPTHANVLPDRASLSTSGSQNFTATVSFDFTKSGVIWSMKGCAGGPEVCGSLGNVAPSSVTYTAPATVPPSTPRLAANASIAARGDGRSTDISVTETRLEVNTTTAHGDIAFGSNRDASDDIYLLKPGGAVIRLTSMGRAYDPAWSRDGTKLAFTGKFSDEAWNVASIYVMNADGSGLTRLASTRTNDLDPTWSPDGRKIAFVSYRDGNLEIYVMNADGSGQVNLTHTEADDYAPAWSPDGTMIAFTSGRGGDDEIYLMNADGSGVRNLTNNSAGDAWPAWSPDGTRIAFASVRGGNGAIYVMNADGTGVMRLTNDAALDTEPAWSPDGTRIVFSKTSQDPEGNLAFGIYEIYADGSGTRGLTTNGWGPSWRPPPAP